MHNRDLDRLRILHLIPSLGPGGAERQLSLLAPAFAKRGFDCAVVFGDEGPNLSTLKNSGVMLHELPSRGTHDARRFFDILSFARNWQPDIIQTWLTQMDILGSAVAHILKTPHILSERSSRQAYPPNWKNNVRCFAGRHANGIVANSKSGAEYWRKLDVACHVEVIPNALTPHTTDTIPNDELPPGPFVMFAGRLSYEKNLPNLITGIALALETQRNLHALLFGEGPLQDDVERMIAATPHADRIHLCGFADSLGAWMNHASATVAVSDFEGHPNVVIEAAAAGCPLILSDISAHREIFTHAEAKFVNGHDPVDIGQGILAVINKDIDTEKMAARAQQLVNACQVETQIDKYLEFYKIALNR